MPELPQMQALAERLDRALVGRTLARVDQLSFTGLKTVVPAPTELVGSAVTAVTRRAKYLQWCFDTGPSIVLHLSNAGRLDIETTAKSTKPRGVIVRFVFDDGSAVLVREHGTQRKAGWWVLAPGAQGPLGDLGPEPGSDEFAALILTSDSNRHLHTQLRDQHFVAGLGRGHTDDLLNTAGLSPFASLRSLDDSQRRRLLEAIDSTLAGALALERTRTGGLSQAKLGEQFVVHNRAGEPCPRCATTLLRVSYESYEIVYCPQCQTGGKVLADRRLSRLLR